MGGVQWSSGLPGLVPIAFIYVRDKPRLWSPSASNAVQLKPTTAREEPTKIATNGLHLTCSRKAGANELSSVSVTVCAERGRGGQRRRGKYETPLSEPDGAQRLFAASNALQPDMKANATIIIFHFTNHPLILTCSSTRVSARIFQIPPPTTLRSEAYREEVAHYPTSCQGHDDHSNNIDKQTGGFSSLA